MQALFRLVDRNRRNAINRNEFCMAFHIIVLLGKKVITRLPSSIPEALVTSCASTPPVPTKRQGMEGGGSGKEAPPVPTRRKQPAVPPRR